MCGDARWRRWNVAVLRLPKHCETSADRSDTCKLENDVDFFSSSFRMWGGCSYFFIPSFSDSYKPLNIQWPTIKKKRKKPKEGWRFWLTEFRACVYTEMVGGFLHSSLCPAIYWKLKPAWRNEVARDGQPSSLVTALAGFPISRICSAPLSLSRAAATPVVPLSATELYYTAPGGDKEQHVINNRWWTRCSLPR